MYGVHRTARHLPYDTSSCTKFTYCTMFAVLYGIYPTIRTLIQYVEVPAVLCDACDCVNRARGIVLRSWRCTAFPVLYGVVRYVSCSPLCMAFAVLYGFTVRYEVLNGIYCAVRFSPYCTAFTVRFQILAVRTRRRRRWRPVTGRRGQKWKTCGRQTPE